MKMAFFGDSYDIVKHSLLRWLGSVGPWSVHPMFTEAITPNQVSAFTRLIGVPVLTSDVLTTQTDRAAYFNAARRCTTHLFLDPDTGLRLRPTRGAKAPYYLFFDELVSIVRARPERLTLVFDQSLARGQERPQLELKQAALKAAGIHTVAYVSHACYFLVGLDAPSVGMALETLLRESWLPGSRFLPMVTT